MGFRFYTERLQVGSCSSVSIASSRYSSPWCNSGGTCTVNCYTGDRMFAAIFYNYVNALNQNEWPYWYSGDYYDLTFTFSSVTQDVSNYANEVFAQGTLTYEFTQYFTTDCTHCGCTYCYTQTCYNTCYQTCYQTCYDIFGSSYNCNPYNCNAYNCNPYPCNWQCCTCNNCRWIFGWDYRALSNQGVDGWSQPNNALASNIAVGLVSQQYGVETELFVRL